MIFFKKKEENPISYQEPVEDPFKTKKEEEEAGGKEFSVEPPKSDNLSFENIGLKKEEKEEVKGSEEIEEIKTMVNSIIAQLKTILRRLDELEENKR